MAPIDAVETLPYSSRELPGVVADVLQHRPQILQVEQQQSAIVGDLEHERQHALLRRVQVEEPAEQQRADVRNGRAYGKAAPAEHVPEHGRVGAPCRLGDARGGEPLLQLRRQRPGRGHAREVALDVGEEDRDAKVREMIRQHLKADGLSGSRRARNEAVAIAQRGPERQLAPCGGPGDDEWLGHVLIPAEV